MLSVEEIYSKLQQLCELEALSIDLERAQAIMAPQADISFWGPSEAFWPQYMIYMSQRVCLWGKKSHYMICARIGKNIQFRHYAHLAFF